MVWKQQGPFRIAWLLLVCCVACFSPAPYGPVCSLWHQRALCAAVLGSRRERAVGPHLGSPPDPYLFCTPRTLPPQPYACSSTLHVSHVSAPHVSRSPPPGWVRPAGGKEQNTITSQ